MSDCIFCKIANHEIPSTVVFEDEKVLAFRDLEPQAPSHVLVIPKEHHANICDGVDAQTLGAMAHAVSEVVKSEGIEESGYRVITNAGPDAGQTVMHFHMHVMGGKKLGMGLLPSDAE